MKLPVRILKYLIAAILFLSVITAGSVVLLYNFYPRQNVLKIITESAEKTLNRRVDIGELDYSLRGIVLKKVILHDDAGGCAPVIASAERAVLRFSMIKVLIKKDFDISYLRLDGLRLYICFSDGSSNIKRLFSGMKADSSSEVKTNIESVRLNDAVISIKNPVGVLKPLEGDYTFTTLIEIDRDKRRYEISDAVLILPPGRGTLRPELTIRVTDNDFEITGGTALQKCSLPWVYTWGRNLTLPYMDVSGRVSNLRITSKMVEGSLKGASTLTSRKTLAVNGYCRVGIDTRTVFLSNIQGGIQSSSFLVEEFLFGFDGDIRRFKVRNADASIPDIQPILHFLPADLYGKASGDLSMEAGRYTGDLEIDAGYGYREGIIKNLKGSVHIRNSVLGRTALTFLLYDQPAEAVISSTDGGFKSFECNLSVKEYTHRAPKQPAPPAGTINVSRAHAMRIPFQLNGRIDAGTIRSGDLVFTNSRVNYATAGNKITFTNASTQFMGGEIRGSGSADLSQAPPRFEITIAFDSIKVQSLTRLGERFRDRMFGIASGTAEIGFSATGDADLLSTLSARSEFTITKGKLVNTGVQNGLGVFLEEMKYKLQDLEFNKIYGNAVFAGNILQITSFIFNAADVRLRISGSMDTKLAGDLRIDLEFSQHFIEDLPNPAVLVRLNKYKKNNWFVIPFRAKGRDVTDAKNLDRLY